MSKIPTFTIEQKKYLRANVAWLGNARLDEWIEYLQEPQEGEK